MPCGIRTEHPGRFGKTDMLFNEIYRNKKVLVTGHTGFKGSWLTVWLAQLGAKVYGYALSMDTPTLYDVCKTDSLLADECIADIRDRKKLNFFFEKTKPDIVFHLAAQLLVRLSYFEPVSTYETNVIGTLNLLESARNCGSVAAFVNVTTDKCYENREKVDGYTEDEPMGGYDMYSSSKGCAELLTSSYRRSFLENAKPYALASARAGNVIGGGDWAKDRLVPDCIKAFMAKETVCIRSPKAVRPWQHVLEPLAGYLRLGQLLLENPLPYVQGYNFGPERDSVITVAEIAEMTAKLWGCGEVRIGRSDNLHEAILLLLNNEKAKRELGVYPVYSGREALEVTVAWYKAFYGNKRNMLDFTKGQIGDFCQKARTKPNKWVS